MANGSIKNKSIIIRVRQELFDMSVLLDLPEELEAALSTEADRLNIPLSEYILRLLAATRQPNSMPMTGAELVAYWQNEGLIGTRLDITDSSAYARELRRSAESR